MPRASNYNTLVLVDKDEGEEDEKVAVLEVVEETEEEKKPPTEFEYLSSLDFQAEITTHADFKEAALKMANALYDGRADITTIHGAESLLIHFPEGILTNSLGETHPISNTFVVLPFRAPHFEYIGFEPGIMLTRTTVSAFEAIKEYQHSHATGHIGTFASVCLGNGELAQFLMECGAKTLNYKQLFNVISCVEILNRWESLEGTPFLYIRDVSGPGFLEQYARRARGNELRSTGFRSEGTRMIGTNLLTPLILLRLQEEVMKRNLWNFATFIRQSSPRSSLYLPRPLDVFDGIMDSDVLNTITFPFVPDEYFKYSVMRAYYSQFLPPDLLEKYCRIVFPFEGTVNQGAPPEPVEYALPPIDSIPARISRRSDIFTFQGTTFSLVEVNKIEEYTNFYKSIMEAPQTTNPENASNNDTFTQEELYLIQTAQAAPGYSYLKTLGNFPNTRSVSLRSQLNDRLKSFILDNHNENIKRQLENCISSVERSVFATS